MKRFAKNILVYVLPMVLILTYFETQLPSVANNYSKKKMLLERSMSETEVLILGSSLSYYGIDPSFFMARGFNLSLVSQSIFYDFQLISKYESQMPKLRLCMIAIDYFTMEYNLGKSPEYWRMFFYERYFGIPLESKDRDWDIKRYSLIRLYGGRESLRLARKRFKVDLVPDMKDNGFFQNANAAGQRWNSNSENGERIAYHHSIMDSENIETNITNLENIVRLLRLNDVIPALVTLPATSAYSSSINQDKYRSMLDRLNSVCGRYNVVYRNYLFDDRFTSSDFIDADHLSPEGAEKFSRLLNEEMVVPLLKHADTTSQQ
jgi:hypothetical protein